MTKVKIYHATDRRCYYGAPSSDLLKEINSINEAKHHLKSKCKSFEQCYNQCLEGIA